MLRVGLIGSGRLGEAYARVLRHLDQVEVVASCGVPSLGGRGDCSYPDAVSLLDEAPLEAVVLASASGERQALLRRALLKRRHVLAVGPFTQSAQQTDDLATLARRAGCLLMFGEERFLSPAFLFLERAVAASAGSWRPRYLRLLDVRARGRRGPLRLSSLAVEDLAACLRLVRRAPRSVSAIGSRGPSGGVEASFINLTFPGGTVASLQISLNEAAEAWQAVAALGSRTVVMDDLDPHLPIRVLAEGLTPVKQAAGAAAPPSGGVWQAGSLGFSAEPFDGALAQARRFLDALASAQGTEGTSNAELWCRAAALWEAAEGSMTLAGAPVPVQNWSAEDHSRLARSRSHLRLIVGNLREPVAGAPSGRRPALKVLSS